MTDRTPAQPWTMHNQGKLIKFPKLYVAMRQYGSTSGNGYSGVPATLELVHDYDQISNPKVVNGEAYLYFKDNTVPGSFHGYNPNYWHNGKNRAIDYVNAVPYPSGGLGLNPFHSRGQVSLLTNAPGQKTQASAYGLMLAESSFDPDIPVIVCFHTPDSDTTPAVEYWNISYYTYHTHVTNGLLLTRIKSITVPIPWAAEAVTGRTKIYAAQFTEDGNDLFIYCLRPWDTFGGGPVPGESILHVTGFNDRSLTPTPTVTTLITKKDGEKHMVISDVFTRVPTPANGAGTYKIIDGATSGDDSGNIWGYGSAVITEAEAGKILCMRVTGSGADAAIHFLWSKRTATLGNYTRTYAVPSFSPGFGIRDGDWYFNAEFSFSMLLELKWGKITFPGGSPSINQAYRTIFSDTASYDYSTFNNIPTGSDPAAHDPNPGTASCDELYVRVTAFEPETGFVAYSWGKSSVFYEEGKIYYEEDTGPYNFSETRNYTAAYAVYEQGVLDTVIESHTDTTGTLSLTEGRPEMGQYTNQGIPYNYFGILAGLPVGWPNLTNLTTTTDDTGALDATVHTTSYLIVGRIAYVDCFLYQASNHKVCYSPALSLAWGNHWSDTVPSAMNYDFKSWKIWVEVGGTMRVNVSSSYSGNLLLSSSEAYFIMSHGASVLRW